MTHKFFNKKIRFHFIWCLVFFFLFQACKETKNGDPPVIVHWKARQAESLIISRELLPEISGDSIEQFLQIQLANIYEPILGDYTITDDAIRFQPLIPFTRGLKYEVRWAGKLLAEIEIDRNEIVTTPEVLSVYPTCDTMPQNLLKIYIVFSMPMQEGDALKNITVIKNEVDTIPQIFLDLQPELWNKERTILTLWLDPGRIKRDLQPNIIMGSPLQEGSVYQIAISQDWRDAEGDKLVNPYRKHFVVRLRDSQSPEPVTWTIHPPKAASRQPLKIELHESLDYVLLKNAVRVFDNKGNILAGVIETEEGETILYFIPSDNWSPGDYTLEIESRLEDLAGNNLNRLFDKDLSRQNTGVEKEFYKRSFHIQ